MKTGDTPFDLTAQAFSHYTFERSKGDMLVTNLRRIGSHFVDPTIHTKDDKRFSYSETNLSSEGIEMFFETHRCNDVCRRLRLSLHKNNPMDYSLFFSETPNRTKSIQLSYCSNSLCQAIPSTLGIPIMRDEMGQCPQCAQAENLS